MKNEAQIELQSMKQKSGDLNYRFMDIQEKMRGLEQDNEYLEKQNKDLYDLVKTERRRATIMENELEELRFNLENKEGIVNTKLSKLKEQNDNLSGENQRLNERILE